MQIETAMRYHLTLVRMASIKKSTNNRCQRECEGKETLLVGWWECKLVQPLWRTVWRFFNEKQLPYDPAIPLQGLYLKKTLIQKYTCILMFKAALFTIAKTWKQPKCPSTDEWIKTWYTHTHTHNGIFSSVQSLRCVRLFATPWTAERQASLSITNSRSLLKLVH